MLINRCRGVSRMIAALLLACCVDGALSLPAAGQLPADQAVATLSAPDDLVVELFASEPMVVNPAAIDVDTQGRVWVAEIQWYRRSAQDPAADRIKVLEDTTGDGRADKVTVFAEGVFCPMSICVAGDKVYVATSPDLWVYEDKDGDLVADGPPVKLLSGFDGFNHDHGAHSLVLGPDHKWWMAHGDRGFDVTGVDGSRIQYQWGAMLRGELDGSQLEIVARNFRNPYEVAISSFGEAFCSDNDNDGLFSTRVCWIVEGGDYGWFGRPGPRVPTGTPFGEGWHFRAPTPGYVPATLVTGFGSPCGMCFYEGDALGPRYKNVPWHTDNGPREVRIYPHRKAGFGMQADKQVLVTSTDAYFRPDDVCAAPDGSLFVSDWYDGGVGGHAYDNPDQGRIYRIRPTSGQLPPRIGKPGPYQTIDEAIVGLQNPNLATQYLARERLLAEGQASVPALVKLLAADDPNHAARALWVLDRLGGVAREQVRAQLGHDDEAFRALAVRILRRHGDAYRADILARADDPSAEVRREVLLALPNLSGDDAFAVLATLAGQYDGTDRYLLEAINIAARGREQPLYATLQSQGKLSTHNLQLLQLLDSAAAAALLIEQLGAAATDDRARSELLGHLGAMSTREALGAALSIATDDARTSNLRRQALDMVATNLVGLWGEWAGEEALLDACRQLLTEDEFRSPTLALMAAGEMSSLAGAAMELALDESLPLAERQQAIETVGQLRAKGVLGQVRRLVANQQLPLAKAAASALVAAGDWDAVRQILANSNNAPLQAHTGNQMMANTSTALVVRKWFDDDTLPSAVRKQALAKAVDHPDANVRAIYEPFIPAEQRPPRLGEAIRAEDILALTGDPRRGEQIFSRSSAAQCGNCHRVRGFGRDVGPDLTMIGKKYAPAALLETILDPSKAIGPEYIVHLVETRDGQVHAGFILERNNRELILKDANGRRTRVRLTDIEAMEAQTKSMMPELVLRDVSAQDAADLLAYLLTLTEPFETK